MKYDSLKRKEILTHETTWVNVTGIKQSKMSQSQKETVCFYMRSLEESKLQSQKWNGSY